MHVQTVNGDRYMVYTICGRVGPGLFIGGGLEGTTGVGTDPDPCKETESSWSLGFGGDAALGPEGISGSVGASPSGVSATVSGKIPFLGYSVGASVGIEGCYQWLVKM